MDSEQWTVNSGQLPVDSGQWTMDSEMQKQVFQLRRTLCIVVLFTGFDGKYGASNESKVM
jgi:hypothetical protein